MTTLVMLAGLAFGDVLSPGLYVLETRVVTQSQVPIFGRNRVTTTTRALARVQQQPGGQTVQQTTCRVEVEDSSRAETRIPQTFIAALPSIEYRVVSEQHGFRWVDGVQRVGLNGEPDLLPEDSGDPVVSDTDQDGNPGATVHLDIPFFGTVDVYVVQRTRTSLIGQVTDRGALGVVEVQSIEQSTLGSSHPLFRASPRLSPIDGESSFSLLPVAEGTRCDQLWAPP